jgi:hypothetical protein
MAHDDTGAGLLLFSTHFGACPSVNNAFTAMILFVSKIEQKTHSGAQFHQGEILTIK